MKDIIIINFIHIYRLSLESTQYHGELSAANIGMDVVVDSKTAAILDFVFITVTLYFNVLLV